MATINGTLGNDFLPGGNENDLINGLAGDDELTGGDGNDTLNGADGSDTLLGGAGNDVMKGGKGNDYYFIVEAGDKATELAGQGRDSILFGVSGVLSYTLPAAFEDLELTEALTGTGNAADNFIEGNLLANTLAGLGGNDFLTGWEADDTLVGGAGNDYLDGGDGKDKMDGGAGNDTYVVSQFNDQIIEAKAGGIDTIETDLSDFSLASYATIENLTLTNLSFSQNGTGNDLSNKLTGNAYQNTLEGGLGNDTLDGGGENDILKGGAGDDTYFVDNGEDDLVYEDVGKGKDVVFASNNYTLAAGQEIESLILVDQAFFGFGNEFANAITANNAGGSYMFGRGGNDTVKGGIHADNLDGGSGNDLLIGGKGNDSYFVDSIADKIVEAANQGSERVYTAAASFTLGANLEDLYFDTGAVNGTGNTLANFILGNTADNVLDGVGGNDSLTGANGDDTLIGGAGADSLQGGAGIDLMKGGVGNDKYFVNDSNDIVSEVGGSGVDWVFATASFVLGAGVEALTLDGTADINGTGNDLANYIVGNAGKNILTGNKGNDTLGGNGGADTTIGGVGNDTYYVDDVGDVVEDKAGQGKDTVNSTVSFQIQEDQEIETLMLSSDSFRVGIGNSKANVITMTGLGGASLDGEGGNDKLTGSVASDILDGGTGNDVLAGGKGDDFYFVDRTGDKITELANQGKDTVNSELKSYTLGANLEDLVLVGTALNGTGNSLGNFIIGNSENNALNGLGGNDNLYGGDGADTLKGGAGGDFLDGGIGADVLYGEAGADDFHYQVLDKSELGFLGGDTINGFQSGVDVIDLLDLVNFFGINGDKAFDDGFVILTKNGADTLVQFDEDGSAGAAVAFTLATVVNATVTTADVVVGNL